MVATVSWTNWTGSRTAGPVKRQRPQFVYEIMVMKTEVVPTVHWELLSPTSVYVYDAAAGPFRIWTLVGELMSTALTFLDPPPLNSTSTPHSATWESFNVFPSLMPFVSLMLTSTWQRFHSSPWLSLTYWRLKLAFVFPGSLKTLSPEMKKSPINLCRQMLTFKAC